MAGAPCVSVPTLASVTPMSPADLEGSAYGPMVWSVSTDSASDFVELTGDDPARWEEFAPPGFAAAALFAVAPDLLSELYDTSVIHGEQTFAWDRPISIGSVFEVTGTVTRVRERGGVNFITFEMEARGDGDPVLSGKSLFLVSGEAIPGGDGGLERPEPHHSYRGDPGDDQLSASRADLVRYASATRDWNPVHWDHEAGVAAGFPGVVVHGLLQAAWALRIAAADATSSRPFASARFRFRNPLLPGRPVDPSVSREDGSIGVVIADADTEFLTANIEVADG